jgi:pimeloyl-ACP methyl ester carboxylesterase
LESEHDVLALTLAGHYGAAPLPAGVTASVSALTDAAERALDEAGFDAAHLVGNSLGGWIAFELAKRRRAASVVAFSPAGGRPRTSPEEARRVARKIDLGFRLARVLSPVAGPLTRWPIGRRALFSQLAAHPERSPPQEAAYRLRALAGCAVLPGAARIHRRRASRAPGRDPLSRAVGLADRRSRAAKGAVRPEFAVRPARSAVARAAQHRPHADVRRS